MSDKEQRPDDPNLRPDDNLRNTGGRIFPPADPASLHPDFSPEAAENKKPKDGVGLTESLDADEDKERHSEGVQPPNPKADR